MINKFNIAKALLDNAQQIATLNAIALHPEGEALEAPVSSPYVEEYCLFGDDMAVGLSDDSSDIQIGIYQLSISAPKSSEGAKWQALQFAQTFQAGFARGLVLEHGGQSLRLKNSSLQRMDQSDTHVTYILSIRFSVIA